MSMFIFQTTCNHVVKRTYFIFIFNNFFNGWQCFFDTAQPMYDLLFTYNEQANKTIYIVIQQQQVLLKKSSKKKKNNET